MPLGFKHSLFEVALDALWRSEDPTDPDSIAAALGATNLDIVVGLSVYEDLLVASFFGKAGHNDAEAECDDLAGIVLAMNTEFDPSAGPAWLPFAFGVVIIGGLGSIERPILASSRCWR